jgi:hypothetical protein
MPKDFDATRKRALLPEQREFVIGGETFRVKGRVRPEAIAPFDLIEDENSPTRILEIVDGIIIDLIESENDAAGRWHQVRAVTDENELISLEDLMELVQWMIEVVAARPTSQPGGSSPGPGATGTSSTANSDSPVATAA